MKVHTQLGKKVHERLAPSSHIKKGKGLNPQSNSQKSFICRYFKCLGFQHAQIHKFELLRLPYVSCPRCQKHSNADQDEPLEIHTVNK